MNRSIAVVVTLLVLFVVARADNWPQWRGPNLNGVSNEKNLPVKWTTEENVSWKVPMPGYSGSTPIIWRDRIFLNVADGDDLSLWCLNKANGEVLWKRPLGSGNVKMRKQNMSSPSASHGRTQRLRDDRHGNTQRLRLHGQRTLESRHSERIRPIWLCNGATLRHRFFMKTRFTFRCCTV
jgi:hypothetical protein